MTDIKHLREIVSQVKVSADGVADVLFALPALLDRLEKLETENAALRDELCAATAAAHSATQALKEQGAQLKAEEQAYIRHAVRIATVMEWARGWCCTCGCTDTCDIFNGPPTWNSGGPCMDWKQAWPDGEE